VFFKWTTQRIFTKIFAMRISSIFVLFLLMSVGMRAKAQFVSLSAELDTMLWETADANDPLADLAFYGVYNVYANFTDSSDVLSALYSDVAALGSPAMGIDAPRFSNEHTIRV
jgi:hypothetical protein